MKFLVVGFLSLVALASADVSELPALILKQSQDIAPDGSYAYAYETDNGISHVERGTPVVTDARSAPVIVTQGEYQYTAPDGTPIKLVYTADQNGFQPQGDHIPPISPLILRSLEYIRAHPQPEVV